ncbi:hypothetical protein [Telluribacter sp.]|jgi:hypothetical protein|uniref:hypothetical protein n=1 Tax=Telluribacter sp. TaxID=1978767 RepID=UPI002E15952B|nr:hypothetical protein [Telluribacter sp.]
MNFIKRLFSYKRKPREYNLPDGWTETKISEDNYITHIPQEQKDKWLIDKWDKDKLPEILLTHGFHLKQDGRAGTIYYVSNDQFCEIYYELSAVPQFDILIFFDSLKEWSQPKREMTEEENIKLKQELTNWLAKEKIKADL